MTTQSLDQPSSLFQTLGMHGIQTPQKIALRDETVTVTYGELDTQIAARVELLSDVRCLAIALDNSVDWVLWDLAALKAGIPCVPLPPFFSPQQRAHSLACAGVSHLISSEGLHIILSAGETVSSDLPQGTAKVTFTSGTTGEPKGVCLPQSAMDNVARSIVHILGETTQGTHLCLLPLAVLLENVAGVYAALIAGASVFIPRLETFGSTYQHLHDVISSAQDGQPITSIICVPEILRSLMAQIAKKGALNHLKFVAVGGAKVAPPLIAQARRMGLPVYEGYGLSECASVVAMNRPDQHKLGTVGCLLPHVQVQIRAGEILIEQPGFLGYIGQTAPEIFATGDLGELDQDGFLSVTGRQKNVLITSYGRNVSPEWVEATLLAQPAIAQAFVYGDGQAFLSALIVPIAPAVDTDLQSAIKAANMNLPDYAQIKQFHCVPPFSHTENTLTGNGRMKRAEILNRHSDLITPEKETDHDNLLRSTC